MTQLEMTLGAALNRVRSFIDLLPVSAADQVITALAVYDVAVAKVDIVQKPGVKPYCEHQCVKCGERV